MKKTALFFLFTFVLAACGDETAVTEQAEQSEGEQKEEVVEDAPLDSPAPLIREDHANDERKVIRETVEQ